MSALKQDIFSVTSIKIVS